MHGRFADTLPLWALALAVATIAERLASAPEPPRHPSEESYQPNRDLAELGQAQLVFLFQASCSCTWMRKHGIVSRFRMWIPDIVASYHTRTARWFDTLPN